MSIEDLHTEVQGYRDQAGRLAEDFARLHSEIESNPSLTVEGKREQLEPQHAEVVERIQALHAREKSAVKTEKERLERRLFGLTATASNSSDSIASFRDAQARANKLEDQGEADEMYRDAIISGDKILSTAILKKAISRGWSSIKEDFLDRNTAARGDLDDLAALTKYTDNGFLNIMHYMPPSLNLPHSSGFPKLKPLHSSGQPQGVRALREFFGTDVW